jgi:hypothetical protein
MEPGRHAVVEYKVDRMAAGARRTRVASKDAAPGRIHHDRIPDGIDGKMTNRA